MHPVGAVGQWMVDGGLWIERAANDERYGIEIQVEIEG